MMVIYLVGGIPTPLKNMRTRQLGYDDSQYMEIWKNNPFMFQTTNQILYTYHHFFKFEWQSTYQHLLGFNTTGHSQVAISNSVKSNSQETLNINKTGPIYNSNI